MKWPRHKSFMAKKAVSQRHEQVCSIKQFPMMSRYEDLLAYLQEEIPAVSAIAVNKEGSRFPEDDISISHNIH